MFNLKIVLILLLINSNQVNAIGLNVSTSGGFLIDGSSESVADFEWGDPRLFFGGQSSLAIGGVNSLIVNNSQYFKVAKLTYKNTDIKSTKTSTNTFSDFSSVYLEMTLHYADSNSVGSYNFGADIDVTESSNGDSDTDDRVSVLFDNGLSPAFSFGGTDYVFELLGFENKTNGFDSFFIQPEGSVSSVDLYAKITAVPIPSALWLFMTALSGFIITGNRKRK